MNTQNVTPPQYCFRLKKAPIASLYVEPKPELVSSCGSDEEVQFGLDHIALH